MESAKPMQPKLFIFDDMITDQMMSNKKGNFLMTFATSGRHRLFSTILLVQHLKSVPLVVRQQMTNILIGRTPDQDKLEEWLRAYRQRNSKDFMIELYYTALETNNTFGFLHIHTEQKGSAMYSQNLEVDSFLN